MKKFLLTTSTFSLLLFTATAQKKVSMTRNAGSTTFGIHAGVNFFTITGKDQSGNSLNNKITTGFNLGANAEVPLGSGVYLQPGLDFTGKGTKYNDAFSSVTTLNYLEIPVNIIYKPILGKGNLLLGAGPYIGFGMGGKTKSSSSTTTIETKVLFTNTYNSSANQVQIKKTDAGANFLAGYEFSNKLSLAVTAQLGLMNINPGGNNGSNDKSKWNNTGYGFSLGYRF